MVDGDEVLRVSDAERERVAGVLGRAQAEGRLELGEFDERVRSAYAATTRADLAPLTADLPAETGGVRSSAAVREVTARRPHGLGAAVGAWAVVGALNLGLWAVLALTVSGPVYPWWIWVVGPWGVALALRALAERATGATAASWAPVGLPCGARRRR